MFRLLLFLCLITIIVGITAIRGRVTLNGDVNQKQTVPTGAKLFIRLEDTSVADRARLILKELEKSSLLTFPFDYEIRIPKDIKQNASYSLSAQLKDGDNLLYINDFHVPAKFQKDRITKIDIPVVFVGQNDPPELVIDDFNELSWPELLGREGTYAVKYIQDKTGYKNVFIVSEGSFLTMDYQTDRVRVFVNKDGIVTQVPRTG